MGKNGYEIKNNVDLKTNKVRSGSYNEKYILHKGITWTYITSSNTSVRYVPDGFLFDNKGSMVFFEKELMAFYFLAFFSTKLASMITKILNPTISFQPGDMTKMPLPNIMNDIQVIVIANECISLSKNDWDSYETSWDFKRHPLV